MLELKQLRLAIMKVKIPNLEDNEKVKLKSEVSCIAKSNREETTIIKLKSGVILVITKQKRGVSAIAKLKSEVRNFQSVSLRFPAVEQKLWNSGQEIPRVFSVYDRFHFKFEDFT